MGTDTDAPLQEMVAIFCAITWYRVIDIDIYRNRLDGGGTECAKWVNWCIFVINYIELSTNFEVLCSDCRLYRCPCRGQPDYKNAVLHWVVLWYLPKVSRVYKVVLTKSALLESTSYVWRHYRSHVRMYDMVAPERIGYPSRRHHETNCSAVLPTLRWQFLPVFPNV